MHGLSDLLYTTRLHWIPCHQLVVSHSGLDPVCFPGIFTSNVLYDNIFQYKFKCSIKCSILVLDEAVENKHRITILSNREHICDTYLTQTRKANLPVHTTVTVNITGIEHLGASRYKSSKNYRYSQYGTNTWKPYIPYQMSSTLYDT